MIDTVHTENECRVKILAALKTPQYLKDTLGDLNKKYTALDLIEQLIPLMHEAEECAEMLWGDSFPARWRTKTQQQPKHICGLQGFDLMKGDSCPACNVRRR